MAQYIDKFALVAEIDRRIKVLQNHPKENHKTICHLDAVKQFLNTLEMKEVDLERERMEECPYRLVRCMMYDGHLLQCRGACSWVVDYNKLKELKTQKGEEV